MDQVTKNQINKIIDLFSFYIQTRLKIRISLGIMAAGLSILGFNNYIPYIAILIKPELSEKIDLTNYSLTILGLLLIIIGAMLPVFLKIFNHYRILYINDLKKINEVNENIDFETFKYQLERISETTSIYIYELDLIEKFYNKLLSENFSFNNSKANQAAKKLGNELRNFHYEMAFRVSPSEIEPNLYDHPRRLPSFDKTSMLIKKDCERLLATYGELKNNFDFIINKKIMKFFK